MHTNLKYGCQAIIQPIFRKLWKIFSTTLQDSKSQIEEHISQVEGQTVSAELEEIEEVDEHTTASLQVNELTQKIKELNQELSKRKKIIEDKDAKISALKGLLTSQMMGHERERKLWESRLAERIADFKSKLVKSESEYV